MRHAMTFMGMMLLLNYACGPQTPDPGTPQVEEVGDEVLVTVEQGSLSETRPADDQGRRDTLADYLVSNQVLFGAQGVDSEQLQFAEALAPSEVTNAAGETYRLLALHQTYEGAPVIDEYQMAAYMVTADGDELRRVRGCLRDPSDLPVPPDPEVASVGRVDPAVQQLIADYGLSADRTEVDESPVISASQGVAGYLVTHFRPTETGSFERFRAIVDPRDLRIVIIEDQPACDATLQVPAGVSVAASPAPDFEFPGLIGLRTVRIHAVQLSDGDGSNQSPITRQQVRTWVDAANEVWWPQANVLFTFDSSATSEDFEPWRATLLNTVPSDEAGYALYESVGNVWALLFHHKKLVVFFRARGGGGWSWGPPNIYFVSMPAYTNTAINKPAEGGWITNDALLSHEIGHYFGLAHPFGGADCAAVTLANSDGDVNGQDGDTTADDVQDTNPDLNCVPTDSLTCVGGMVSYNGQTWSPPWNNIMSYHDCLPESISQDQIDAINLTLQHPVRAELLP